MPPFKPETEYRNDRKPHDVATRPFHRINSPSYDKSVDEPALNQPKRRPNSLAQDSGARTPADYAATGLTEKLLQKVLDFAESALTALIALIPVAGPVIVTLLVLGRQALKALKIKDPIDSLKEDLAKFAGQRIEGAMFDRFMRASPAWVPVGREKYGPKFVYDDDSTPRTTQKEEEREVEGTLVASFQLANDIPQTQWTRYDRWSFHLIPMRGYAHLLGEGNIEDPDEQKQIADEDLNPVLHIYNQRDSGDHKRGAIECLWDSGAFSHPLRDGGSHGVMFHPTWPQWPMTGDHFWAAGRWVYDCMRPVGKGDRNDLYPTQIHPCKAIATGRFEGHKFPENAGSVPTVRFFFFASSEGGYVNFRTTTVRVDDPNDKNKSTREVRDAPINLRDRDYVFIVDLPPLDEGKSPYPIGHTLDFMRNTLVLRPRLLTEVRFAPFATLGQAAAFTRGPEGDPRAGPIFHEVIPLVEILRPEDPTQRPSQARVTVPLTKLPPRKANDPEGPEVYGFELALGWHDPDGSRAAEIIQVRARLTGIRFHSSSGPVRIKTCINGRWHVEELKATEVQFQRSPQPLTPVFQTVDLFLPKTARIQVTTHGVWRHGFGEFVEGETLVSRQLNFGGLIELHPDMQKRLDQLRQLLKEGKKLTQQDQAELDQIEELLDTLDVLIGRRRKAEWLVDIDAEVSKDKDAEAHRASAIARELFVRPTPVINRHDEPAGWTEFIDPDSTPHKGLQIGSVVPEPRINGTAGKLKADQDANGRKGTRIELRANRFTQLGSGNNLAELTRPVLRTFGRQEQTDYSLDLLLDVVDTTPPPPPTPRRSALIRQVRRPFPFSFYAQNTALMPEFAPILLIGVFIPIYAGPNRQNAIRALIAEIRARATDVVGLSENWLAEERDRIATAVRDLYPVRRDGPALAVDGLPSGLMLLSRHPIVTASDLVYRISKGDDGLASKGIIHARIAPAGAPCPIDVFLTHTQSPFKSGTDIVDPGRMPALKAQLRILGAFVAARRDPQIPALAMGDFNVDASDPTIYQPLLEALGQPKDLWPRVGVPNSVSNKVLGLTNDFQRSFEAKGEHPPKPQNDPLRHQAGFRLDYFLSRAGSIFDPAFGPMEVVLREQSPGVDMSDHYGVAGRQTEVSEKIFDQNFPIRRVRVAFSAFKCLNVTGNNPAAEADDDEVQFELGVRSGTIDPVTVKSNVFEGINAGSERRMDGPVIEFAADPGQGLEIRIIGKEIGGLTGDTDLGTSRVTVSRSELLEGLDATVRRTLPLLTGADGEYAVEVAILTT